jgi:hypothetical protein
MKNKRKIYKRKNLYKDNILYRIIKCHQTTDLIQQDDTQDV